MNDSHRGILIVDDEEDFRILIGNHFRRLDYEVLAAEDGLRALELFEQEGDRIDLVMTDLRMPKMDGADLTRALRRRRPFLPIIGVTGHADLAETLAALDTGAYYYLDKPLPSMATLEQLISNAIKLHSHEAELDRLRRDPSLADFHQSGLVDAHGQPVDSDVEQKLVTDFVSMGREFQRELLDKPELIHSLSPRQFEELVADLLDHLGYEVTLTPASKDGGFDLYAATKEPLGSFLYLVECKKYRPDRPVGVELVRNLYGVVRHEDAAGGVLVATSYFTAGAREFQMLHKRSLKLQEYDHVIGWLGQRFDGTRE